MPKTCTDSSNKISTRRGGGEHRVLLLAKMLFSNICCWERGAGDTGYVNLMSGQACYVILQPGRVTNESKSMFSGAFFLRDRKNMVLNGWVGSRIWGLRDRKEYDKNILFKMAKKQKTPKKERP